MRVISMLLVLLAATGSLGLAGCGLDQAPSSGAATVMVTHAFGARAAGAHTQRRVSSGETVEALLRRFYRVEMGPAGAVVDSIGGARRGPGLEWSVWVNGIEPAVRVGRVVVHPGDRVWWDLHDSSAAANVPAVVGSFPEPFTNGSGGRRLPTVLTCAAGVRAACDAVARAFKRAGIKVGTGALGSGSGSESLAVVVGTFASLRGVIAAELVAGGPSHSGVYAQFGGAGDRVLELDNAKGRVVRELGASAGLVAATDEPSLNQPVWLVTGNGAAGVAAAAGALTPARLRGHFAVAVAGGQVIPVPLDPLH